ncbi:MAG: hypothetical protein ACP5D2_03835 [Candidatus Nanoarchaeia archaeon]
MKLSTLTIFMIILTFTIVLFQDTSTIDPDSGDINFEAGEGDLAPGADTNSTYITGKLWNFVKNPHQWSTGSIIFYLAIALLISLAEGTIYASISNSYAPDTYIFGIFYSGLMFLGAYPTWLLYNFINGEMSPYVCGGASACFLPTVIATIFSFGLGITWVFTVIKSWRTAAD